MTAFIEETALTFSLPAQEEIGISYRIQPFFFIKFSQKAVSSKIERCQSFGNVTLESVGINEIQ